MGPPARPSSRAPLAMTKTGTDHRAPEYRAFATHQPTPPSDSPVAFTPTMWMIATAAIATTLRASMYHARSLWLTIPAGAVAAPLKAASCLLVQRPLAGRPTRESAVSGPRTTRRVCPDPVSQVGRLYRGLVEGPRSTVGGALSYGSLRIRFGER